MAYITEAQLEKRFSLPVSLPLTQIKQGDWLVLSSIKLTTGMAFDYKVLQLQLVDFTMTPNPTPGSDPCAAVTPTLKNQAFGYAYVAIFKNFVPNTDPSTLTYTGTSVDVVNISTVGIVTRDITKASLVVDEVAEFSFLLVNNCQDADLRLAVNGQVILTIA